MAQISGETNVHYGKEQEDGIGGIQITNAATGKNVKKKSNRVSTITTSKSVICILVLFFVNLLNYMDRFTIAGVLTQLQSYFNINDADAGLLQTVFIIFFMVFAPVCGFLGDRYNRKFIMIIGLIIWILAVLASSFIPPDRFFWFVLLRGVVGIGEASYSTIAPTIIADLFVSNLRSRILMFFYFAIPVGSGLGFIAGSMMASKFGGWEWGVRVTPPLGFALVLALLFFLDEPERGLAEREFRENVEKDLESKTSNNNEKNVNSIKGSSNTSSYVDDLKYLLSKKSYIWSVIGYLTMLFVVGTLSWWAPAAITHAAAMKEGLNETSLLNNDIKDSINLKFGIITCLSGFFGVSLGVVISQFWKEGKFCFRCCKAKSADALVSAIGSLLGAPLLVIGYYLIDKMVSLAWVIIFFAVLSLCLNWAIVVDMLMYIIVPHRRNVANSWLILLSHLFGDASGPYIVGIISDFIRGHDDTPRGHFFSLIYAFYVVATLLLISGFSFLMTARNLPKDIKSFEEDMGISQQNKKNSSNKPNNYITTNSFQYNNDNFVPD